MNELNYVVRHYSVDGFMYSIHCSSSVLDEVVQRANASDLVDHVKIIAYFLENEDSEV